MAIYQTKYEQCPVEMHWSFHKDFKKTKTKKTPENIDKMLHRAGFWSAFLLSLIFKFYEIISPAMR